jgi:hypothetical protein
MRNLTAAAGILSLIIGGCSSRPREFTPNLGATASDQTKVDAAYAECKQLYVTGKLDSTGRLASGGVGAAAGGAVGVAGSAAAAGAGLYGGMAVMSATLVLMPVAIIGGAVGMAKIKRHKKELAVQRAMDGCLHDRGFEVASWQKAPHRKATTPTSSAVAANGSPSDRHP